MFYFLTAVTVRGSLYRGDVALTTDTNQQRIRVEERGGRSAVRGRPTNEGGMGGDESTILVEEISKEFKILI